MDLYVHWCNVNPAGINPPTNRDTSVVTLERLCSDIDQISLGWKYYSTGEYGKQGGNWGMTWGRKKYQAFRYGWNRNQEVESPLPLSLAVPRPKPACRPPYPPTETGALFPHTGMEAKWQMVLTGGNAPFPTAMCLMGHLPQPLPKQHEYKWCWLGRRSGCYTDKQRGNGNYKVQCTDATSQMDVPYSDTPCGSSRRVLEPDKSVTRHTQMQTENKYYVITMK